MAYPRIERDAANLARPLTALPDADRRRRLGGLLKWAAGRPVHSEIKVTKDTQVYANKLFTAAFFFVRFGRNCFFDRYAVMLIFDPQFLII